MADEELRDPCIDKHEAEKIAHLANIEPEVADIVNCVSQTEA